MWKCPQLYLLFPTRRHGLFLSRDRWFIGLFLLYSVLKDPHYWVPGPSTTTRPKQTHKLAHIAISINEWLTSDDDYLFALEAPYVSLSQLSFSVPVSPSYPKQAIPLSLPSICCSLTINRFFFFLAGSPLALRVVAAFFRFCNSQWWKNVKQGIRKNTLSNMALGLKWAAVKTNVPRTPKNWNQWKPKKTNIISAHVLSGVCKTSGAKILIKVNMIYSLTEQSGPKGARTENAAFISLSHLYKREQPSFFIGGEKNCREKNVPTGKSRAPPTPPLWLYLPASMVSFLLHRKSSTCAFSSWRSGIMFFQEKPWRNLAWGPFAFPWALIAWTSG